MSSATKRTPEPMDKIRSYHVVEARIETMLNPPSAWVRRGGPFETSAQAIAELEGARRGLDRLGGLAMRLRVVKVTEEVVWTEGDGEPPRSRSVETARVANDGRAADPVDEYRKLLHAAAVAEVRLAEHKTGCGTCAATPEECPMHQLLRDDAEEATARRTLAWRSLTDRQKDDIAAGG